MTKLWITLFTATAILVGCQPIQPTNPPSPDSTPEGLDETLTQTYTPTKEVTPTPEPTNTPERGITAQIIGFTNTSQEIISINEGDKANSLTIACRAELFPLKSEDKKLYFPKLTGLSIQDSETIILESGGNKLKFGYCNTEMYGTQETPVKALATILVIFIGKGEAEKPVFLPTIELKPGDLTDNMRQRVSLNLKVGETLEFVRLVPSVSPEGNILWPDANLGITVSADGPLRWVRYGKELPKKTDQQDEFIPMVTAVRQKYGTLRYDITDPVEGRMSPDQVLIVQAKADGSVATTAEVAEWNNSPSEVIEGKQFYNVFHIINEDGSDYLLAARADKTPEEALADTYSQLAQAKVNEEGKWVWQKLPPPLLSWGDAVKYASQDCLQMSRGKYSIDLEYELKLAIDFGVIPPGRDTIIKGDVKTGRSEYINPPGCFVSGLHLNDNRKVFLFRNSQGILIVLSLKSLY